jgi:NADPH:quinone reductase-like Zn-dependent oxidoreductase
LKELSSRFGGFLKSADL